MKYQYHDLSEAQFENLAIAVCREILGTGVQGFAQGIDGGCDARFHGKAQAYKSQTDLWDGLIIIQAKHTNGFNKKFSEPDFFENKSSVIKKETPKIKVRFKNGELDYYMLFSNRKLTALSNEKITNFISDETGLDKSKIALFGIEALEDFLKYYPKIIEYFNINPFQTPLSVEPDELAEIIIAFAKNQKIFSEVERNQQIKKSKEIKRTTFNEKNNLNNLSDEYAKLINKICEALKFPIPAASRRGITGIFPSGRTFAQITDAASSGVLNPRLRNKNMIHYFDDITDFLAQPENDKLKNLYDEVADEFNMKIVAHKQEYDIFDRVLNYLYDFLIGRDVDLKKNKKMTRVFLHYMYYYCDIGDNV